MQIYKKIHQLSINSFFLNKSPRDVDSVPWTIRHLTSKSEFYANFVKGMPNEWGGYFFLSNTNRHSGNNDSVVGTIGFLLCHFGEWNKVSRKYIEMWDNFHLNWRLDYTIENVTSFWQGFGIGKTFSKFDAYSFTSEMRSNTSTQRISSISWASMQIYKKIHQLSINSLSLWRMEQGQPEVHRNVG
jgi:hypothetical protein